MSFITKTPPASVLLKKAAGLETASGEPNRRKVGKVSRAKVKEIAGAEDADLNAMDIEGAMRMIEEQLAVWVLKLSIKLSGQVLI